MTTNYQIKQSASMQTQDGSPQSSYVGRSASTKAAQLGGQLASQQKTNTANSTRTLQKPSTNTLATEREEMELLAGMFNDLKKKFREDGLLTLRRALPTAQGQRGDLHLVISSRLEDLMNGVANE